MIFDSTVDMLTAFLILMGALILIASLFLTRRICRQVKDSHAAWRTLFFMIMVFAAGYLVYFYLIVNHRTTPTELVVSLVFFGGACFVYMVNHLSLATIAEMKRIAALERHRASHDDLTGLPNRCYFTQSIDSFVSRHRGGNCERFAVLFMDIDRFKVVNDTLGHHYGDLVLKEVSHRLKAAMNESHSLVRMGGDEFALLVDNINGPLRLQMVSDKVIKVLSRPFVIEGHPMDVDVSVGIAVYPDHGTTSQQLIKCAELAMYKAKSLPNHLAHYDVGMETHSIDQLSILGDLRRAIDNDELMLLFHPQVDLRTRRICGVEALVRWPHPKLGLLTPDKFIPIAEQSGIIHLLDRWVLEEVFEVLADWHKSGIDIAVSANLSPKSLHDPQLIQRIMRAIHSKRFSPSMLQLEITESAVMADADKALAIMTRLSNAGVGFSIDDFGTGYSSLSYLKRLPANEIKIDKSFVVNMDKDENDAVIVRSTIDLAHNMGRHVVAEGVEDQDVLDLLVILGCDQVQGFFISRPLSRSMLKSWILASGNRIEALLQPV